MARTVESTPSAAVKLDFDVTPPAPMKGPGAFLDPEFLEPFRQLILSLAATGNPLALTQVRMAFRWYGRKHDGTRGSHTTHGYFIILRSSIEPRSDVQLATIGKICFQRAFSKSFEVFISGGLESCTLTDIAVSLTDRTKKSVNKERHRREVRRRERVVQARPEEYFRGKLQHGRKLTIALDKKGRPKTTLSVEHRRYRDGQFRVIVRRRITASGKVARRGAKVLWRAEQPERATKRRRISGKVVSTAHRKTGKKKARGH